MGLSNHMAQSRLDHLVDLTFGVSLGTLAGLWESLLHLGGQSVNLSSDLGIGVEFLLILESLSKLNLLKGKQ